MALTTEQLSALSGAAALVGGASDMAGGWASSRAYQDQADYQRLAGGINADFANLQGADVMRRGKLASQRYGQKVGQLKASQRAAFAAQGVNVDSGSAADVQAETASRGAEDARTIENNAWREAWGLKAQASGFVRDANIGAMASENMGNASLITGGIRGLQGGLQAVRYFGEA